ncbi:MAG: hypothetical protein FWF05_01710 [Oscillospiraceae bacterium]|nr:hypothetical protein [Oscillospiraceae bacterium]
MSVCAVYAAADDDEPKAYTSASLLATGAKISATVALRPGFPVVFQPGDTVTWPNYTGTATNQPCLRIVLFPDALKLETSFNTRSNQEWIAYVNGLGTVTKFAESQNKYKSFSYNLTREAGTGSTAIERTFTFPEIGDVLEACDVAFNKLGDFPIDFELTNDDGTKAEFLGWVLYQIVDHTATATSSSSSNASISIVAYANWDRTLDEPSTGGGGEDTTKPELTPIMSLRDRIYKLFNGGGEATGEWTDYLTFVPNIFGLLLLVLDLLTSDFMSLTEVNLSDLLGIDFAIPGFRKMLYDLFKIPY